MVPLPHFASFEALNRYLEQRCRERQGDVLRGHRESIATRLERDLEAMTALPEVGGDGEQAHQLVVIEAQFRQFIQQIGEN